jgi:carotenoid cleavage dioxygenase-like enzyme
VPKIWAGLSGGELIVVTEVSAQAEERGIVRGIVTDIAIGYGSVWVTVDDRGPQAD